MPGAAEIYVSGLADMQRAFRMADKDMRKDLRKTLRGVAEPVQERAQEMALGEIRNMTYKWSRMRVGVSQNLVYVAPRQRGIKRVADPRKRGEQFATLLMDRAMQPALDAHTSEIEREVGDALDDLFKRWER